MRSHRVRVASSLAALAAAGLLITSFSADVRAAGTPPSPTPPEPQEPAPPPPQTAAQPDSAALAAEAHAKAGDVYKKGWQESEDAKAALKVGKTKDATKKFAKALKHFDEATKLDPSSYEAWNMVGFCSRKTGDLKRAFAAYDRALALNPDYDEAHEYLGEAYLMSGDVAKAKEQLDWLKAKKSDEAGELEEAIEAAGK